MFSDENQKSEEKLSSEVVGSNSIHPLPPRGSSTHSHQPKRPWNTETVKSHYNTILTMPSLPLNSRRFPLGQRARPWRVGAFLLIILILLASLPTLQTTSSTYSPSHPNYVSEDALKAHATLSDSWFTDGANDIKALMPVLMNRVEDIRELKFKETVPVETINRTEYTKQYQNMTSSTPQESWELAQQEYEALYTLTEGTDAKNETESFYTQAILGFYDAEKDKIVIVEGSGELDKTTLAHELDHALMDQYYPRAFQFTSNLTDAAISVSALLEGDARLVEAEYQAKFASSVSGGTTSSGTSTSPPGFTLIQLFPYIEGVNFIYELKQRSGWEDVNKAYENIPQSSEQIIHPERYEVDQPTEILAPDRAAEGWQLLGRDTLGEFAIFTMFWNQGQATLPRKASTGMSTYLSPLSDGWDGDDMVVYKRGEDRYGYVWELVWDSTKDAEEFIQGYEDMLKAMGATITEDIWTLDSNDFIKIWQEGRITVIVNAPSREEIPAIYQPGRQVNYTITFDAPEGNPLTIDDVTYDPQNLPTHLTWLEGSIHTLSFTPQTVSKGAGAREVYSQWSDGTNATERAITINGEQNYTAKFKTQYYLKVDSPYGNPQGAGWYDAGMIANFSVTRPLGSSEQHIFAGWSGDTTTTTANATTLMDSPKTVVANWGYNYTQPIIIALTILIIGGIILGVILVSKRKTKNEPPSL